VIVITLVWLIGQGWTAYVYESQVNPSGHGGAVAEKCASQGKPQAEQHSRTD
jgi:hypothetical protein